MDDTNQTQPPVRINGSLMANYLHSKAVIIGFVTRVRIRIKFDRSYNQSMSLARLMLTANEPPSKQQTMNLYRSYSFNLLVSFFEMFSRLE